MNKINDTQESTNQENKSQQSKVINIEEIKTYLPHRYPFLLIDRITDYDLDKGFICGYKNLTANEEFFNGHFPHHPVMPGVLMIEALAQLSGVLYFLKNAKKPSAEGRFYFAGVDSAKFKRVVIPGDKLLLQVQFIRNKFDIWMFNGQASVDGDLACGCEFKIAAK